MRDLKLVTIDDTHPLQFSSKYLGKEPQINIHKMMKDITTTTNIIVRLPDARNTRNYKLKLGQLSKYLYIGTKSVNKKYYN